METEIKDNNTEVNETTPVVDVANASAVATSVAGAVTAVAGSFDKRAPRDFKKNTRRPVRRESRVKPEFDQKIISIRRVARVVTGGRRFSFSVAIVAGNRKGSVGVGLGKAGDTSLAIEKAFNSAKKNMVTVNLTKEMSIPHEVTAKFSSSVVTIMPAPDRGIVAGSSVRIILDLAGVKDVGAKIRSGSKNKLNIAKATIVGLSKLSKPRERKVVGDKVMSASTEGVSAEVSA
jgi:small subunit ribosomal protein S5